MRNLFQFAFIAFTCAIPVLAFGQDATNGNRVDAEVETWQEYNAKEIDSLKTECQHLAGEVAMQEEDRRRVVVDPPLYAVPESIDFPESLFNMRLGMAMLAQPKFEAYGHTLRGGFVYGPRLGFTIGKELGNGLQIEWDVGYARVQEQMSADRGPEMLTRGGDLVDFGLLVGTDLGDSPVSLAGYAGGIVHNSGSVADNKLAVSGSGFLIGAQVDTSHSMRIVSVGGYLRLITGWEMSGVRIDKEPRIIAGMMSGLQLGSYLYF